VILTFEGIDGAGKTTLAEAVSSRFNIPIYHAPSMLDSSSDVTLSSLENDSHLLELSNRIGTDWIMDRWFPSEHPYGSVFRGTDRFVQVIRLMQNAIDDGHIFVYVRIDKRDMGIVRSRMCMDDYEKLGTDKLGRLMDAYDQMFDMIAHDVARNHGLIRVNGTITMEMMVESIGKALAERRPDKDEMYMSMAELVARRSTCLARRQGAVLLSERGHVIATGYNGAPRGMEHPKQCNRLRCAAGSGTDLDGCTDVHAEENVIVQASLNSSSTDRATLYTIMSPCTRCARMLVNAGIERVVYKRNYGDVGGLNMLQKAGIKTVKIGFV